MAINFPNNPVLNSTHTVGSSVWRWNGYAWVRVPDPGDKGEKGEKGEKGDKGTTGDKGQKGDDGEKGVKGEDNSTKGEKGDAGVTSVDKITEGNTEAEVVDDSVNGHFKVTTEGVERFRINAGGDSIFKGDVQFHGNSGISSISFDKSDNSIKFVDNAKIKFGDSGDLEIYHGNSPFNSSSPDQHSYIRDAGTGDLVILSNQVSIRNAAETEDMARFYSDGRVELRYDNTLRFETTSDGVKIGGGLQDEDGHVGAAGSILSSTGTALDWIPASSLGVITDKISEGNTKAEVVDTGSNGHFLVETEGIERARIDASGRMGLGTNSPGSILHLKQTADAVYITFDSNSNVPFWVGSTGTTQGFFIEQASTNNSLLTSDSSDYVSLYGAGTKRFETTSDGVKITGGLQDKDGQLGNSGQVLSSTGTQLNWIDASSGGTTLESDAQENTVGGTDAGLNLDTDTFRNTLFGYQAGEQINSGDDNTFIGHMAGDACNSGYKNVGVGAEVLPNLTSGYQNVAIGWEAGRSMSSGYRNVAIGDMAGRTFGSAVECIAIGRHAASNFGSGTRVIGIGAESVWLGGTDLIGIGKFTMARGGSQVGGIGIGYQAGRNNLGDHNIYLGYLSGFGRNSSPYSTGEYNIAVGYRSLYNVDTSFNNIAIGSSTANTLTTGSNNIIIGSGVDVSSATMSNQIILGDSNITKFSIPGINVVLKDNNGTPTQGHVLTVDSNGEASFESLSGNNSLGTFDKIEEGNTKAEVVDTGTSGRFIVETEGTERFRIDSIGSATFTSNIDVDGHTNLDNVSVAGVTTFSGGSVIINPTGANHSTFTINSNESNDTLGPIINLSRNSGFFSSTEPLGEIRFVANNNKNYGKITGRTTNTGSGTEDGKIQVSAIKNGTETVVTEFTHNGVDIPFDLDVDGHTNLDNVSVAGFSTFTDGVKITGGLYDEDGHVGAAGSILSSTGTALDWIPASSLGGVITDKISEGNTKAEVVDTGSNGHFLVETEGTEKLRVTSTGQLNLAGDMQFTAANPELEFNNGGPRFRVPSANTLAIHKGGGLGSTNDEVLRFTSDGHAYFNTCVGIGSTIPRQKFDVIGKAFITDTGGDVLSLESTVNTSRTTIKLYTNGNDWELGARGSGAQNATNSFYVYDMESSEYRMVINPTGNVGIGTKDPDKAVGAGNTAKLSVGIVSCHQLYVNGNEITGSGGGGGSSDPVGTIVAWAGSVASIPNEYQLCDGSAAVTATLQTITGTNVPDLRDRFIIGANDVAAESAYPGVGIGSTGGSADAVVVEHKHTTSFDGKKYFPGGGSTNISYGGAGSYPADTFSMDNEGVSGTDKNLPPYYALCYIIKHTATSSSGSGGTFELLSEKSATGTEVEFTGIPSDALEITVMFRGVSLNANNNMLVQLGYSNTWIASGYVSNSENTNGSDEAHSTNGFAIFGSSGSAEFHGSMIINKSSSNSYTEIGEFRKANSGGCHARGSLSSVSGAVERLKVTIMNQNNQDAFDAGTISVSYKTSGSGSGGVGIGSTTKIQQDNTFAEVVDTGSDGHFKVVTEGDERLRITAAGNATFSGIVTATSLTIDDYIYHQGDTNTFIGFESNDTIRFNTNGSDKFKINSSGHLILADDNDTYIHHPAFNSLAVTTGGSERLRITSNGVGIGTTNPDDPVLSTNTNKLAVGIVTCHELYVNGLNVGGSGAGSTASSVPVGSIVAWAGLASQIDTSEWQLCDGGTPVTEQLQTLLGSGNNVPDLRDKFVVGAKPDGNSTYPGLSVGETGGSADATLVSHSHTINNHTHSFSTTSNPGNHDHNVDVLAEFASTHGTWQTGSGYRQVHTGGTHRKPITSDAGGHTHSGTTGNPSNRGTNTQGSSATNANLPPYYALCYIIKHTASSGDVGVSKVAILKDQKNQGVPGGNFTAFGWRDRDLTVEEDPSNFVDFTAGGSQSSGSAGNTPGYWSLAAGTYKIEWSCPGNDVSRHKTRLVYSTTESQISTAGLDASALFVEGSSENTSSSSTASEDSPDSSNSVGYTIITLTETTWFKILHYCTTTDTTYGFGHQVRGGGITTLGPEIYSQVRIEDLATAVKSQDSGTTKIAIIQDEKPESTNGGTVSNVDTWIVRDLNTITDPNSVGITSATDGKFSLPAGSYAINFSAPAMHVDEFQARLAYNSNENFSGTTNYVYGSSQFSGFTASSLGDITSHSTDRSRGDAIVNLTSETWFRIEQSFETSPADGAGNKFDYALGVDAHRGAGAKEVYTQVIVQDLATATKSGVTIGDKIQEGDTKAEVIDTGTDGRFVVTTEGVERVIVDPSGYLNARADIRLRRTASNDGGIYFGDSNNNYIFGADSVEVLTFATGGTGDFVIGETVTGGTSNVTAIVKSWNSSTRELGIYNKTGNFNLPPSAETVTGASASWTTASFSTSNEDVLNFATAGTERVRITPSGQFLVGATSADVDNKMLIQDSGTTILKINNTDDGTAQITLANTGSSNGQIKQISGDMTFSIAGNEKTRITSSGLVAIKSTGQLINESGLGVRSAGNTCVLKSEGNINHNPLICWNSHGSGMRKLIQFGHSGTYTSNGSITTNGTATYYNASSDYRMKQDEVLITDGIEKVKLLKPRRFKWKSNLDLGMCDGFFAHEIEEATPASQATIGAKDAVATESDVNVGLATSIGDPIYQQIDQSKLIPILTAALKEAIAKIETLETKVAALEGS